MHRPTFDVTSRRARVGMAVALVAALVIAAFLVDPEGRRASTSTAHEPATGSVERGADSVGGAQPLVDPAVDSVAPLAEVAPRDELADGPAYQRDAPAATAGGGVGGAGGTEPATAPDARSRVSAPAIDARIVRNGAIELRVPRHRFEQAWGDVQAAATGTGGYVIGASRSGAGNSARRATITMRVPGAKFEAAIERLREVRGARVGRLDVSSQDVTQEFVDTRSRLRHDRAVEGRLLALLADAEGVSEVLAVQARLDTVQQQIEVARGRLEYLDNLTTMGTIEVSIATPSASGSVDRDERSELGEAFRDAGARFVDNVAGAVVWLGGALPALIVLAVAAIVARVGWRRRAARPARTPADPT